MKHSEKVEAWLITATIIGVIIRAGASGELTWPAVGMVLAAAAFWAPHAYLSKLKSTNSHSVLQSQKKIETLTTSLNTLALRLKEVEKLSQQTAKTQGLSQLNRKFTL